MGWVGCLSVCVCSRRGRWDGRVFVCVGVHLGVSVIGGEFVCVGVHVGVS